MKISDLILKTRKKLFIFRTLGQDSSHVQSIAKNKLRTQFGKIEVDFFKKKNSKNQALDIPEDQGTVPKFAGSDRHQKVKVLRDRGIANVVNNRINSQSLVGQQSSTIKKEIRGRRGRYECSEDIVEENEKFSLYYGIHNQSNQKVIIKEYSLCEGRYSREERRKCKEKFASMGNIGFCSEDTQDFRIVTPLETIAPSREKCCYLITKQIENSVTLREQLEQIGSLAPKQVVKILDRTLQSLWFLHSKRFRFPNGEIKNGIPHGNLSLDSLLVVVDSEYNSSLIDEPQLSVYLSDLGLWNNIFARSDDEIKHQSFAQDLVNLGIIGLQLLSGNTDNLNLADIEENWFVEDSVLEAYIFCLLGIKNSFDSALTARQELLRLKNNRLFEHQQKSLLSTSEQEDLDSEQNHAVIQQRNRNKFIIWTSAILGMSAIIGGLSFFGIHRLLITPTQASKESPCCLDQVQLPEGNFEYAIDSSIWQRVLKQKGFVSANQTIKNKIESKNPQLKNYQFKGLQINSTELLQQGKLDFALSSWNDELPSGLIQEEVAYHGLAVFVAFNDENNRESIPKALRGKISIEQLRSLYTKGYAKNIPPNRLSNWDVKLYVPFETEAINRFEKLIFDNIQDRRKFKNLTEKILSEQKQKANSSFYKHSTRELLGDIFQDAEGQETIGIGFGFISQIFGQCAVYPLAIQSNRQVIQPLKDNNNNPISVDIDLCDDKGSYWINSDEFSSQLYPLGYKLTVVYPENNQSAGKKFAELLRTQEAQYLLRETGIVPLKNLEK